MKGVLYGGNILLGNVYAPNAQDEAFCASLLSQLADIDYTRMITEGDLYDSKCILSSLKQSKLTHMCL